MTGNYRLVFAVTVLIGAVLVAIGLWAFWALWFPPPIPELTGTYLADDGGIYYVQRSGNTLWWAGMSLDKEPASADLQWHRGLSSTNVFRGNINSDNTVTGEWSNVPRGASLNGGTLSFRFSSSGRVTQFTRIAATGNFVATTWQKIDALDDLGWNGDIVTRFDQVHKNTDHETIHDNLKPYRDQTVVYGRLVTVHRAYTEDNEPESEIPHINYGPNFNPTIRSFQNFGQKGREFDDFDCSHSVGDDDADFDLRLKVDLNHRKGCWMVSSLNAESPLREFVTVPRGRRALISRIPLTLAV